EAGSQAIMAQELRAARGQYLSTRTLYLEASGYVDGRLRVGAQARLADLDLAFARKLDQLPAPVALHDPAGRTDHRRQMRELMQTFEIEAALSASRALD